MLPQGTYILCCFHFSDGTVYFNHDNLKSPTTKDEIVEIVKFAFQNGRKIRVLGSGHSRSALALSEDILVSLHKFKGLVEVDLESKRVTVRGGTTLKELNAILEEKGLALSNMPAIADPTIAGAIATGEPCVENYNVGMATPYTLMLLWQHPAL